MSTTDEADLIERMWTLICNSSDLKNGGLKWKRDRWGRKNIPVALGLSTSEDSVEWRRVFRDVRVQYHNWLGRFILTHQEDPINPTIGELIDALNRICDCGQPGCNATVLDRGEANAIIERLKGIAVQERDSSTAG